MFEDCHFQALFLRVQLFQCLFNDLVLINAALRILLHQHIHDMFQRLVAVFGHPGSHHHNQCQQHQVPHNQPFRKNSKIPVQKIIIQNLYDADIHTGFGILGKVYSKLFAVPVFLICRLQDFHRISRKKRSVIFTPGINNFLPIRKIKT